MQNDLGLGAIGAVVGALIAGLFAWLTQRGKSQGDIEVAAIAEWQKLYNALSERVSDLEKARAKDREQHAKEIAQLIQDHSEAMEALKANHREEMKALRDYCEGLEATIRQNSASSAYLLGDLKKKPDGK